MQINSIGVCLKIGEPRGQAVVQRLIAWCADHGIDVLADEAAARDSSVAGMKRRELCAQVDLIVSVGGDGTLLSVARATGTRQVPILGVNLGRLGFLTEINSDELEECLERMLVSDLVIESRMRLEVQVLRAGEEVAHFRALNDAVIAKSALSRMIDLVAHADGLEVSRYYADGLIVSTPTGSTAYSLSAGGPILMAGLEAIAMTPICPHSLTQRAIVLPQQTRVEIEVRQIGTGHVTLTVDGQEAIELREDDRVISARSPSPAQIVASPFRTRYEIMHEKLRWGER
jgi:NAD+ kinase